MTGEAVLEETIMTQYSMKKGMKLYGDPGMEAVLSELRQIHQREVMKAVPADSLDREAKKKALQYLMCLNKKQCGKIKGRGCANGRKQRLYISKQEASSPTVSIESLMISCIINAKQGRNVATVDIPRAFMQVDIDEIVHMCLEGTMVNLYCKTVTRTYNKQREGRKSCYMCN
jgi:hypothetical protein